MSPTALVTGASSGIGAATARILVEAGWRVFAAARHWPTHEVVPGLELIALDVTDPQSIEAAKTEITEKLNGTGLNALVNNAGIGQIAPLEAVSLPDFRAVFEVNVFGLVAVTQAFLPLLRQARGRIVNLSSVGGLITIPFGGALCATKHAVEAISDALRMELVPAHIDVIAIRPASIHSPAADKLATDAERIIAKLTPEHRAHYEANIRQFVAVMQQQESTGSSPDVVGHTIHEALEAKNPQTHYSVGEGTAMFKVLTHLVPTHLRDELLRHKLGLTDTPGNQRTGVGQ